MDHHSGSGGSCKAGDAASRIPLTVRSLSAGGPDDPLWDQDPGAVVGAVGEVAEEIFEEDVVMPARAGCRCLVSKSGEVDVIIGLLGEVIMTSLLI